MSYTVEVRVDAMKAALAKFAEDVVKQSERSMDVALESTEAYALSVISPQIHRRTGKLERSFGHRRYGPFSGKVYNTAVSKDGAPYPHFLDVGTKAHEIKAKNAPFLVFYWEKIGQWMRLKKVSHPGTAPRPFVNPSAEYGERTLWQSLELGISAAAHEVSR